MAQLAVVGDEPAVEVADFAAFWLLYPRHVAKKDALRAWARIPAVKYPAILESLVIWRKVWLRRGELDYVPYPATWLNGERWEDEPPAEVRISVAAHVPVAPSAPAVRGEMPESVRAALAKLRQR